MFKKFKKKHIFCVKLDFKKINRKILKGKNNNI